MRRVELSREGGQPLAWRALRTENARERLLGWMGKERLEAGEGLLISPCSAVHSAGMRLDIDVVFLDRELRVLKLVKGLKPGGLAFAPWWRLALPWANAVLELPSGAAQGLHPGDRLILKEAP